MTGVPLEVTGLTKRFGPVTAVDNLSFTVQPGRVTGFLGPNGSGKTTTLRCLLGLVTADAGTARIGGTAYADLADPARGVGAALEASGFHPGRSGRDHLRVLCLGAGLPGSRADEVLEIVGLTESGRRSVAGYSLGMRQRLSLAAALLGDPGVLVLDEPANGLDPEGIAWLRVFLRHLAAQGRTVLVSSHVLAEVEQTVDDVLVIARGRLVRATTLADLIAEHRAGVRVVSPDADRLAEVLRAGVDGIVPGDVRAGADPGSLVVEGVSAAVVGRAALRAGIELHELRELGGDLEQVFLELTGSMAGAA